MVAAITFYPSATHSAEANADIAPSSCVYRSNPADVAPGAEQLRSAEQLLREMVDHRIAPGAVLMVEQHGKILIEKAYGFADIEASEPMRPDSLFRIYSMTKPVTSFAALQLVERGELDLDAPVALYIPEFADVRVWRAEGDADRTVPSGAPLRVRHLLTHSAGYQYGVEESDPISRLYKVRGIPLGPGVGGKPVDGSEPVGSSADLASRLARLPLLNVPGERFEYGHATDILGRVLEVVTGKKLSEVLHAQIFAPLAMTSTAFRFPDAERSRLTTAYSAPSSQPRGSSVLNALPIEAVAAGQLTPVDRGAASVFADSPAVEFGGAGLVSSAADYLRFAQLIRGKGTIDGQRLLSRDLAASMMTDQLTSDAREASSMLGGFGFGFGLAVKDGRMQAGPSFLGCGAFWGGAASTYFWIDPQNDMSVVLMTQVFGGDVKSYWLEILRSLYREQRAN